MGKILFYKAKLSNIALTTDNAYVHKIVWKNIQYYKRYTRLKTYSIFVLQKIINASFSHGNGMKYNQ